MLFTLASAVGAVGVPLKAGEANGAFAFNCDCTLLVTLFKYPNCVLVTSLTATLPLPLEINALLVVKLLEVIVVAAPVIVSCFPLIS